MTIDATGLGGTLRAWRDRLSPAAVGLRREELAELTGISVDYVVRLEQGRATTPSAQVVAALARDSFPIDGAGPGMSQWPVTSLAGDAVEVAIVSDLRRASGRFPDDSRLTGLITLLTRGNQRFAELLAAGAVGTHREDYKIVEHPGVGPIEVDCDVLTDGDAELKIVILTAAPDTDDESKLRLALLAGVTR